jgi:nucleoside-diphosphate-sugar epimerase
VAKLQPASFWSGKRVVVPGGAGFIGSYVSEQLLSLGAEVCVVDDLSRGEVAWPDLLQAPIEFVDQDIAASGAAISLFSGADVVMNLAGVAPGLSPDQDLHQFLERENLRSARAVLAGALAVKVPRLLVVSSSCVYPDDAPVPTPELTLRGTVPETVNQGYGRAKRQIENEAIAAAAAQGTTQIAIARPFNVYGARDVRVGRGGHVIPSILSRILSTDPEVVVWGSGRQTRSFIHGHDVARALLRLTAEYAVADPVNIGSAEELSMQKLVNQLLRTSGVEKPVYLDQTKPEGAARKAADTTKLKRVLPGYRQKITFESGLLELIEAFISAKVAKPGDQVP